MPIDFTSYTDPGVYVEAIDPPVNNITAITPTVVALIGDAGDSGRTINTSAILSRQYSNGTKLNPAGIDPFSLLVRSRLDLTQYTSAAIGTVSELAEAESNVIRVKLKSGFVMPDGITNATFGDTTYRLNVDNKSYYASITDVNEDIYEFTISTSLTSQIDSGAVVNLYAPYVAPIKIGTLSNQMEKGDETFEFTALSSRFAKVRVRATKAVTFQNTGDTVTLTDHGLSNGDIVKFSSITSTTGIDTETNYYVVSKTDDTFQVSDTVGGSAKALTTDGTGELEVRNAKFTYNTHDITIASTTGSGTSTATKFATAAEVKTALASFVKAAVTRYSAEDEDGMFYDYDIVFDANSNDLDSSSTLPDVITASSTGFAGGLVVVDQERIFVSDFDDVASVVTCNTISRGYDGTKIVRHGSTSVYFVAGYDYFVTIDPGLDSLYNGIDDLIRLDVVSGGRLSVDSVDIEAFSTDAKQYSPEVFNDLDNIRAKHGAPIDASGETVEIGSDLTLAAQMAMRNGASRVYCVALEENTVEGFAAALAKLEGITEINVVVPVIRGLNDGATLEIIGAINTFCDQQSNLGNLTRAFVGIDGVANSFNFNDFSDLASSIRNSRISLVAPSRFVLQTASGRLTVGGSFAAAAVAGLHSALGPEVPLTRKKLEISIYSIEDKFTLREMLECQSKGVLVLSQESNGSIIIRHGLTTDMTSVYSSEVSVVASRDRLRDLVYTSLLNAGLLGSPMTSTTPEVVVSTITGALETAKRAQLVFDYADVKYRVPTNNPTAIEIRFAYRPTMPLNYILVQFSVDTTSSDVMFQSINEGGV